MKFLSLRANCFWSLSDTVTNIRGWTSWKEMINSQFSGSKRAAVVSVQICWGAPGKCNEETCVCGKDTVVGLQRVREWVSIKACCSAQQQSLMKNSFHRTRTIVSQVCHRGLDYLWTIGFLMPSAHAPSPHTSHSPVGIHWSHKLHSFYPLANSSRVLEIYADFSVRDSNYIY